jgi:hypothetical protein
MTALTPPPTTRTPVAPPPERPIGLRVGLRRLSTGLLVYGTIGTILAIVGLVALLYVGGRIGGLADRASAQVETLGATVDDAATALIDAGATAGSFATTLEQTPDTVRQAAVTIASVRTTLLTIQSQLSAIQILGNTPFGGIADQFGTIAEQLTGLDTRLDDLATNLGDNRDKLRANAISLTALGHRLQLVAAQLRTGVVEDSLDDVRIIVTVLGAVLVMWTAVPAIGALGLGWWLRRVLGPDAADAPGMPGAASA